MRTSRVGLVLIGVLVSATAFAAGGAEEGDATRLVLGTGGTSGPYYAIGGALKGVFEASDMIQSLTVESTGASVMNINNIDQGLNQVALVMSDVAYDASVGRGRFEGRQQEITAIAGLHPNVVQVVATADSGIREIADMAGRRIGVGQVGSGVEQSAQKVLAAAGLTYDDFSQVGNTGYADSVQAMKNGTLDAAFFTSGIPNANIIDVMQTMDVVFVPITGEVAANLLAEYPFYLNHVIPANDAVQYDLGSPVETVSIRNLLIVDPGTPPELTREITARFHEYLGSDTLTLEVLKQFDRDTMHEGLVVGLHPGAAQFYAER